jgi:hypothetical protein
VTIINSFFDGNLSPGDWVNSYGYGGAIANDASSPIIFNCTFTGNGADVGGGMFNNYNSSPQITNCIFWGNSPAIQIYNEFGASPVVTYSDVQGGYSGTGNINLDPLLGPIDYHLPSSSPCKDIGTPSNAPGNDLDGNPRPSCAGFDMGAYEYQCQ